MQTFIVKATNRSGELTSLTDALATKNVNILIAAFGVDGQGVAGFIASDETLAETVLKDSGYEYRTFPSLTVEMANTPGQVAQVSRLLGDQGVNIECFLPVSVTNEKIMVTIGVDNIQAATKALGDRVVDYILS